MAVITKVITEDFGKIFEKAICILYETQYDGKFKYLATFGKAFLVSVL